MTTSSAGLTTGFAVELRAGIHVWGDDGPTDLGGSDTGPNPYELLLSAVAACTCITVSMYCQRKGWKLESISAKYELDKVHADDCQDCDDDAKGYIDRVRSEIFIEGDFDDEQRKRLADVAQRCPVHKTLDHGVSFPMETVLLR